MSGNWFDAMRWSTNPVAPSNGSPAGTTYQAFITAAGSPYTVTLDGAVTLDDLTLGSGDATLMHSAGVLEVLGTFNATSGNYTLNGGTLRGGTLAFAGGALNITANTSNRFDGVAVNGNWSINNGGVLRISNDLTLGSGGTLSMTGFGSPVLAFEGDQSLAGGTVFFNPANPNFSARMTVEGDATLTIEPRTVVRGGWGTIGGSDFGAGSNAVVNEGTISADVGGRWLRVAPDLFTNSGLMEAKNGGALEITAGEWSSSGTITANASALTFGGAWTNTGTINATNSTVNLGGTFATGDWGTFNRTGGQVNITGTLDNSGATLALNGATGTWRLSGGAVLGGTIEQSAGSILQFSPTTANRLVGVTVPGDLDLRQSGPNEVSARVSIEEGIALGGIARLGTGAEIRFQGDQSLTSGTYRLEGNNARLTFAGNIGLGPAVVVTNLPPASGSHMYDWFGGSIENEGLIRLTGPNVSMIMQPDGLINAGTIEAQNGAQLRVGYNLSGSATAWTNPGTLRVDGGTLTLGGVLDATNGIGTFERTGGTVAVAGVIDNTGSTLNLNAATGSWEGVGGTIRGGTVTLAQGAGLLFSGLPGFNFDRAWYLDGVALNGSLTLGQGVANYEPFLGVYNGLALNGTITMTGADTAVRFFGGDQTLSLGTIALESGAPLGNRPAVQIATVGGSPTASLMIAPGVTIRGGNAIVGASLNSSTDTATIINRGRISSDIEFLELDVTPTVLLNEGTLEVVNAGILNVAPRSWINNGLIRVIGGTLNMGSTSSLASFTLGAGTTFQRQGGQVNIQGHLNNTGQNLTLNSSTGSWRLTGGSITGGTLNLQQGAQLVPAQGFNGFGGTLSGLTINGDLNAAGGLTLLNGVTLNGKAIVNGELKIGINGTSQTIGAGEFWFDPAVGSTRHMIVPANGTQTFAAGTTIHGGNGRVGYQFGVGPSYATATLLNRGTISADAPGKDVTLQPGKLRNEGIIEAANGGRLIVHFDTAWSNAGGGVMRALAGSTLELAGSTKTSDLGLLQNDGGSVFVRARINNTDSHLVLDSQTGSWDLVTDGTIKGGQVSQLDGSRLTIAGGTFLEGVTFNQDLWFGNWFGGPGHALIRDGLAVNGTVHLVHPGNALTFEGDQVFDSGTIAMETTTGDNTLVRGIGASTLTLGEAGVVRGGRGTIYTDGQSSFINEGLISADVAGQILTIHTARFQNNGTVQAINGGTVEYIPPPLAPPPEPPIWTNAGTLAIGPGSAFELAGDFYQTETGLLEIALAGTGSGEHGRFVSSGAVTLDGSLILTLAGGFTPGVGDWFDLFDWSGPLSGGFAAIDLPLLPKGYSWNLAALYEVGIVSVVPSPGSAALVCGAALLLVRRRARRSGEQP